MTSRFLALIAAGKEAQRTDLVVRGVLNLSLTLFVMLMVGLVILMSATRWIGVALGMVQPRVELPPPPAAIARFRTAVVDGGLMLLSGQGPTFNDGSLRSGKVGADVSRNAAYEHARLTGLNLLAVMHAAAGDLGRIVRVVKLLGFVNATPTFSDHPKVVNGCSDLFANVFDKIGGHARSAIGVGSLPGNITVEIEAVIEIAA
jgi:enamine deaminase RidA (YjgF/YER057c/UK114 family)